MDPSKLNQNVIYGQFEKAEIIARTGTFVSNSSFRNIYNMKVTTAPYVYLKSAFSLHSKLLNEQSRIRPKNLVESINKLRTYRLFKN